MKHLLNKFISQLEEAIIISSPFKSQIDQKKIKNIVISGMGGSGIAGGFTKQLMGLYGTIPVITNNDYNIPEWVDSHTLAIVSSYSGNTEETISAFNKFSEKRAHIIVISSGGKLVEAAKKSKIDLIKLPDNWPAPRACFGYSLISQLFVMYNLGFLKIELFKELSVAIDLLVSEEQNIKKIAGEIATRLKDKVPIIYSDTILHPVSVRFKQQLNENSKTLAFVNTIPEMNHNELVGWSKPYNDFAAVFINSELYSERIKARISLSKEIIIKYIDTMIEIDAKGYRPLIQMLYSVNLVDWISYYLAEQSGTDAMEIKNIDYLKSELSKI